MLNNEIYWTEEYILYAEMKEKEIKKKAKEEASKEQESQEEKKENIPEC